MLLCSSGGLAVCGLLALSRGLVTRGSPELANIPAQTPSWPNVKVFARDVNKKHVLGLGLRKKLWLWHEATARAHKVCASALPSEGLNAANLSALCLLPRKPASIDCFDWFAGCLIA